MIVNANKNLSYPTYSAPSTPIKTTATSTKTHSTQVQLSDHAHAADAKWQSIANQYDVHNISDAESSHMSRELFDAGFINTTQMMILMAPTSMNESPLKKHDMLNDMKHTFKLSNALGGHSHTSKNAYISALNILEHLNTSRT
ncbi:hypothetical protein [Pseudoalteromonas luteoviolacea]|uniref:Uncharacterized protein n=2 Tax=Pseudoalteromonas luteoviolacea TaxID=43657 RepID=A0A0F6AAA2_9GAMM|nr:hypothetical protein [Pseudoalteromonas luteoviolacea]AOT11812.1 hypothetical protein S40542_02935 [Pseudoalteromonas luteoviolacea]AOT16724.1 hypothetical protein S4054_02935 [Pseudoalteromonas luteoviolacea]KKE82781.1 hypothetical protein N479_17140 [Pseudoalteromonas luteoviolacea S4054]KZN72992.1 hypothetical protein N481_14145 [Pseudoalteromonas luteoviolacea S4047-1]